MQRCSTASESSQWTLRLDFEETSGINVPANPKVANLGHPVSTTRSRKGADSGKINFDCLTDANGRVGLLSTKHMRN